MFKKKQEFKFVNWLYLIFKSPVIFNTVSDELCRNLQLCQGKGKFLKVDLERWMSFGTDTGRKSTFSS